MTGNVRGTPVGEVNQRSEDLAIALRIGRKSTGNHCIKIGNGLHPATFEFCKDCRLNLLCLSGRQITVGYAFRERCPCYRKDNCVHFYYYHYCYLTFNRAGRRITDNGFRSYASSLVNRANRYRAALHALKNNFNHLRLHTAAIEQIIDAFARHTRRYNGDVLWIDV